jgi:hypothetical protein
MQEKALETTILIPKIPKKDINMRNWQDFQLKNIYKAQRERNEDVLPWKNHKLKKIVMNFKNIKQTIFTSDIKDFKIIE